MSDTVRYGSSRITRRQFAQRTVAGAGAFTLANQFSGASVAAQDANPFGEPQNEGGTAIIALGDTGYPRAFVGTSYYSTTAFFVSKLLYTPLILLDRSWQSPGPGLATEWTWSDDGTVLTMSLRDVVFHDGTPLTAKDVEFTYKLGVRSDRNFAVSDVGVFEGGTEYREGSTDELPGVAALDDETVQFTLVSPSSVFELNISNVGILPQHLFGEDALESGLAIDELPFFNLESGFGTGLPVGTGPWKPVDYDPDTNLTFEGNDDYFLGAPILNQLILRFGVEGPAVIAGLQAGEFDSAYLTAEDARSLESSENLELVTNHDLANETVLITATEKEYMSVPVRQALMHALDKDTLIETVTYGYGQRAPSVMMHPSLFPNDDLATYGYDQEQARQLLEEAGWDRNRTLRFGQFTDQGAPSNIVSAVMSMWNDVGIDVEFIPLDPAAQIDLARVEDHVYDVTLTAFAWLAYDPSSSYRAAFGCEFRPSYSNYCNPEYDEAMQTAIRQPSLEEAVPFYQTAQTILQEELPYAPVWMDAEIWAVNSRMHGGILGRGPLNDIQSEKWWIESE